MLVVLLLLVIAGLILVNWYRERYVVRTERDVSPLC